MNSDASIAIQTEAPAADFEIHRCSIHDATVVRREYTEHLP